MPDAIDSSNMEWGRKALVAKFDEHAQTCVAWEDNRRFFAAGVAYFDVISTLFKHIVWQDSGFQLRPDSYLGAHAGCNTSGGRPGTSRTTTWLTEAVCGGHCDCCKVLGAYLHLDSEQSAEFRRALAAAWVSFHAKHRLWRAIGSWKHKKQGPHLSQCSYVLHGAPARWAESSWAELRVPSWGAAIPIIWPGSQRESDRWGGIAMAWRDTRWRQTIRGVYLLRLNRGHGNLGERKLDEAIQRQRAEFPGTQRHCGFSQATESGRFMMTDQGIHGIHTLLSMAVDDAFFRLS